MSMLRCVSLFGWNNLFAVLLLLAVAIAVVLSCVISGIGGDTNISYIAKHARTNSAVAFGLSCQCYEVELKPEVRMPCMHCKKALI